MTGEAKPDEPASERVILRDLAQLMVHDLRNPLAAVSANVSYLELLFASADAREALHDLKTSVQMLQHLVENMGLLATLSTPRPGEALAEKSLRDATEAAVLRADEALRAAGVALRFEKSPEALLVRASRGALDGLLDNLLANVAQHVRRGGSARLATRREGSHAVLELLDDGAAFGPAHRDFSREGQLALKHQGAARYSRGLGLYVIGQAVRSLGGALETTPDAGHGALRVRVPLATA